MIMQLQITMSEPGAKKLLIHGKTGTAGVCGRSEGADSERSLG